MKVKLINEVKTDNLVKYWSLTRPYLMTEELPSKEELLKMSLPLSSLIHYTFLIESSFLLRDLIFTLRPIACWAASNRSIKFSKSTLSMANDYPYTEEESRNIRNSLDDCIKRVNEGEPQDYVKIDLPVMTNTTYVVSLDLRTLLNFLFTLESIGPIQFEDIINTFLSEIGMSRGLYNKIPKSNLYEELSIDYKGAGFFKDNNELYKLNYKVKMNLFSQVIRRHNIKIRTSIWNLLKDKGLEGFVNLKCNSEFEFLTYVDKLELYKLASTRVCWFAQFDKSTNDSWSYILGDYVNNMNLLEFAALLPCKCDGNKCTIRKIMEDIANKVGEEVNTPCPLVIGSPDIVRYRSIRMKSDSAIMKKWMELCDNSIIKLDLSNKLNNEIKL